MTKTHLAAILPQKGGPFVVGERPTPEPGSNEVLIEIKAVALNPVDYNQRTLGVPPVPVYPAVIGQDAAGVVAKLGPGVASTSPELKPGTRVLALATSFYRDGLPDYGAFQQFALAQSELVIPLPDSLSFEQGAIMPLAVTTAWNAWTTINIPLNTRFTPQDNQAVLIWGGASSCGTFAIQTAKTLGFTRIYTTASPKHHAYLKSLGAHAVFDYHSPTVVSQIVNAVKHDGVILRTAHCVVNGGLQPTLDVLKETKGDAKAKVVYSPPLPPDHPTLENTEIRMNWPPLDPVERDRHFYECFHGWLKDGLRSGSVVPSPANIQVEGGGLEGLNSALEKWNAGVSGTKIVVPL
ncbi:GroES-like protein [Canariomyces notabilis]|uniref:GroES-like protein n=1 Tax=Canariomyces notabilis TaxID=2074819 RepID=A0AAN6QK51_9PEZI|nr:GroES-like protein [Canariomyces arenarius]